MYHTYILYNPKFDKYYIGSTKNLDDRIHRHNTGQSKSTKYGAPFWTLAYFETFSTRKEAVNRETQIKKQKSKSFIEKLLLKD